MAPQVDVVIVVGSPNSSNSNRLREVAAHRGIPAYMVDRADELDPEWVEGKRRVGVTAGASAPEVLVREVIARLNALGAAGVHELDGARGDDRVSAAQRAGRASGHQDSAGVVAKLIQAGVIRRVTSRLRALRNDSNSAANGEDREPRCHGRDERRGARFAQRPHERLARNRSAAAALRPGALGASAGHAEPEERERQRLQRQPRPARAQRASSISQSICSERQREDSRDGDAMPSRGGISATRGASTTAREFVELEARALLDQLRQHGETGLACRGAA